MKKLSLMLLVLIFMQGCAPGGIKAPFQPAPGFIYAHYKAPLTTEFNNTKVSQLEGEADTIFAGYSFVTFSFKDASLKKAMSEGYLKKVDYADYEYFQILGVFSKTTIRAYGDKNK